MDGTSGHGKSHDAVKALSVGDDFASVEGRAQTLTEETAAVVFSIEGPPKYEFRQRIRKQPVP